MSNVPAIAKVQCDTYSDHITRNLHWIRTEKHPNRRAYNNVKAPVSYNTTHTVVSQVCDKPQ